MTRRRHGDVTSLLGGLSVVPFQDKVLIEGARLGVAVIGNE